MLFGNLVKQKTLQKATLNQLPLNEKEGSNYAAS
jgi:hypothetical protein